MRLGAAGPCAACSFMASTLDDDSGVFILLVEARSGREVETPVVMGRTGRLWLLRI